MKGLGYQHPQWGHGKWHGELVLGGESWQDSELDPLALENIHIQQVVRATCGDRVGHGVLEQLPIGPSSTLGFAEWFDGEGYPAYPERRPSRSVIDLSTQGFHLAPARLAVHPLFP